MTFFQSSHWGSHILSLWMVHTGCVFVASIHPSRTWMSGSFEFVRWNACVHRLDLGLYSHPKEFGGGIESESMLTPRENSLCRKNSPQRRIEPMMLHQAGQRAQHTTNELFQPPKSPSYFDPPPQHHFFDHHHQHHHQDQLQQQQQEYSYYVHSTLLFWYSI